MKIQKKNGQKYTVRENRNRVFYPKEWIKFYNSLKEDKKPIFDCLINTGGRINEVINLEKRDIDFKNKTILFRIVKSRTCFSDGNTRRIPISSQYYDRLKEYSKDFSSREKLFNISQTAVWKMMRRKLIKTGIKKPKDFSIHNIRKTLETWLVALNVTEIKLLCHFGHNLSTALKYYIVPDTFKPKQKFDMRMIIGDLYI